MFQDVIAQLTTVIVLTSPAAVDAAECKRHISLVRTSPLALHKAIRLIGTDLLQPSLALVNEADAKQLRHNQVATLKLKLASDMPFSDLVKIAMSVKSMNPPLDVEDPGTVSIPVFVLVYCFITLHKL